MEARDKVVKRIAKKREVYEIICQTYDRYLNEAFQLAQQRMNEILEDFKGLGLTAEESFTDEVYGKKTIRRNVYTFRVGRSEYTLKFIDISKLIYVKALAVALVIRSETNKDAHIMLEYQYRLTDEGNLAEFINKRLFSTLNKERKFQQVPWTDEEFYNQLDKLLSVL